MRGLDARTLALAAEIRRDWRHVAEQLERAERYDPAASGPHAGWVALALDHAYEALETLLRRVERGLGLPERTGDRWQAELLEAASLDVPRLRPPVVPGAAHSPWLELLKSRHFPRHACAVELEPARLAENVRRLQEAVARTEPVVERLVVALEQ